MWRLQIEEIVEYIINPLIQASIFIEEIIVIFKKKKILDEVMPTTVCESFMRACSFNLLRLRNPRGLGIEEIALLRTENCYYMLNSIMSFTFRISFSFD